MTIQKDKNVWQKFDFNLELLRGFLPHDWDDCSSWQLDNQLFNHLAYVFEGLDIWLTSIESRLQSLHGDTLVIGWDEIAGIVGYSKRTLQRKKKQLLRDGVIKEDYIGDSPRKRIFASPSALINYRRRKSVKT